MESGPNLIRVGIAGAQAHAEGGVELTEDVQSLLPRAAGGGEPANAVQCSGLPMLVVGGTVQGEALLGVGERFGGAALILQHRVEVGVHVSLADLVAELLEQPEGLLQLAVGLIVAHEPHVCSAEAAVGVGLPSPVGAGLRRGQGGALRGGPVVPVASPP